MATEFTFTWNGPQVTAALRQFANAGVFKAAHVLRNEVLDLILHTSKSGRQYRRGGKVHTASAPGEPPASDTGRLVQSVRVDHKPAETAAIVGVGALYARYLEPTRPFFVRAFKNKRPVMEHVIGVEIQKGMR